MSAAQLRASRALWRRRELYRYNHWHFHRFVSKLRRGTDAEKAKNLEARAHWWALYQEAHVHRVERDKKIQRLPVVTISDAGIDKLVSREGLIDGLYHDSLGYCTGGVGHLVRRAHCTTADHRRYDGLDRDDWLRLFRRDLDVYENAVAKAVRKSKVKITQHMFDAMVSLCFNIGTGGFASSSVVRQLKAGHKTAAADAFMMWVHPPELTERRKSERRQFLS